MGHRFSFSRLRRIAAYEDIAIHTYRSRLLRSGLVRPSVRKDRDLKDGHYPTTSNSINKGRCRHAKEVKMYTDDSTYTAWVSGVRPSLDSIRTYRRTRYVDRYIYRDVIRQPNPKRWGIGLSAGYGIGKDGLSPVLAVTVNWNLWNF